MKPSERKSSLPKGVATFLPEGAARRRAIEATTLGVFRSWGYQEVITPIFEYLDVVAVGLGEELLNQAFKFVDRSSGRIMVLRPDVTPQIARMATSLLGQGPLPLRLCYCANVFRHEEEHAGREREIFQMGAECIGVPGVEADAEMIQIAIGVLEALGLKHFKIAVGHMGFTRGLLEELEPNSVLVKEILGAIARKERAELERKVARAKLSARNRTALLSLPDQFGEPEILSTAGRLSGNPTCRKALRDLRSILEELTEAGHADRLLLDLAEVRRFDYYTGIVFEIFVEGMGYELGGGGRYDRLLQRFGRDAPSTGFALHVERVQSVLDKSGGGGTYFAADLLLAYPIDRRPDATRIAEKLRKKGFRIVCGRSVKGLERQIAEGKRIHAKHLAICEEAGRPFSWINLTNLVQRPVALSELERILLE